MQSGNPHGRIVHYPYGLETLTLSGNRLLRGGRKECTIGIGAIWLACGDQFQFTNGWTQPFRRHIMEFNKEFDASGLSCPLPIVKTKKALADMTSGQVLRVISTDPGSVCDMAAFAEQTGNNLLEQGSENSKFVFYLKKA
jgi:tRNA 2-thiouridine synthesizing protein A